MAEEVGPAAISLRALARRAGVSHSAPVHHFGTLQGLLTALAIAGFEALAGVLEDQREDIYEMGVAYVEWGLRHPGHYAVMWQPRLLDDTASQLQAARRRAWELLVEAVAARGAERGFGDVSSGEASSGAQAQPSELSKSGTPGARGASAALRGPGTPNESGTPADALAAFSLVHGLVSIWLSGALPVPKDPVARARAVTQRLQLDGQAAQLR